MALFNFNFLALLLSEILGGPKFTLGSPTPPGLPLAEKFFFTQSEYFSISNRVFNFNILALVVSEILGGPKFTLGGFVPPRGKMFCTRGEYFTMSNGVFNYNFLALVFSEILGGPKFTKGALRPLDAPIGEIFSHKASTSQYLIVFLISTF